MGKRGGQLPNMGKIFRFSDPFLYLHPLCYIPTYAYCGLFPLIECPGNSVFCG